ncbi:MAG: hypothetical protein KIH69_009955 [Anaerolineae bacterium]|nr:hypothetical protein [Anaerolineae bacterium]
MNIVTQKSNNFVRQLVLATVMALAALSLWGLAMSRGDGSGAVGGPSGSDPTTNTCVLFQNTGCVKVVDPSLAPTGSRGIAMTVKQVNDAPDEKILIVCTTSGTGVRLPAGRIDSNFNLGNYISEPPGSLENKFEPLCP